MMKKKQKDTMKLMNECLVIRRPVLSVFRLIRK